MFRKPKETILLVLKKSPVTGECVAFNAHGEALAFTPINQPLWLLAEAALKATLASITTLKSRRLPNPRLAFTVAVLKTDGRNLILYGSGKHVIDRSPVPWYENEWPLVLRRMLQKASQ